MQTEDSQAIIRRFFDALYYLKANRVIRGKATFTKAHGIDRWKLYRLEKVMASDIFQPARLTYLVKDYGVSATWLLTGRGEIIRHNRWKKSQDRK